MAERRRDGATVTADEAAPLDERLWFLRDLDALRRRLILAEVLGAPLARRPRRPARRRSSRTG